jgi:hypothetical protein
MSSTNPSPSFSGIQYNPEFYTGGVTTQNNKWTGTQTFNIASAVQLSSTTTPLSDNSTKTATTAFVKGQNYLTSSSNIVDIQLSGNVVLLDATQTLTNKTINFSTIQYCDIGGGTLSSTTINLPVINFGSFYNNTIFREVVCFFDTFDNFTGTMDCNTGNFNVTNDISSFTVTASDTITAGVLVSAPYLSGSLNITSPSITSGDAVNGYTTITGNSLSTTNLTVTTYPLIKNQYINSCSTLRVGNFTISTPYFELYPIAPTATQTITLPPASFALLGIRFRFRRVGGTSTVAINSASANIYQNTGFTATSVLILASNFNVVVTCSYITSTTYGWVV